MRLLSGAAVVLVAMAVAHPGASQQKQKEIPLRPIAPLDLGRALDLYAGGRFDDAVKMVARAGDEVGRNLRRHWPVTGQLWINADVATRPRRVLVAAALALETENIRAERGDWGNTDDDPPCAAACVLDWAQLHLAARGTPDRAERTWYLAAAALSGGVRDWRYLQRFTEAGRTSRVMLGLMDKALLRFPSDPALRLEQALAAASRFNTIREDGVSAVEIQINSIPPFLRDRAGVMRMGDGARVAADMLAALVEDSEVGVEARTRLGYLYWTQGNHKASRTELTAAAAGARNPEERFLANFLLGWTLTSRGESEAAIPPLVAALEARPGSQSAAVLLSALELQRGDAAKADAITRASFEHKSDLDPWRLFLYGHHPRLPELISALRREVTP